MKIECIILIFAAVIVTIITSFAITFTSTTINMVTKVKEDCQPRSKMECSEKCIEKCEDEDKRVCMTMPVEECKEVMVMLVMLMSLI